MKAGRDLDALVAEKVMDWKGTDWEHSRIEDLDTSQIPHYSTDIAAAWEVVEKLSPRWKIYLTTDNTLPRDWTPGCTYVSKKHAKVTLLHFNNGKTIGAEAETVMHAICLAALKAAEEKPAD